MPGTSRLPNNPPSNAASERHSLGVRTLHWLGTLSFGALLFSGVVILMCHPRLYWGDVGNDLTPALIELPISRNHQHSGWTEGEPFFEHKSSPYSAGRTFEIFNQNGWGRSLHFLAAWGFVFTGIAYYWFGMTSGHFRFNLLPVGKQLTWRVFWRELKAHLRLQVRAPTGGPQYGLLQRIAYLFVLFLLVPLSLVTGLAMSPAITASYPFLSEMFGGFQSARTIHFFVSVALVLFLAVHVLMVARSGFLKQMRAMTVGLKDEK
jgi:thiosulfate reductase cytochrome b subunit